MKMILLPIEDGALTNVPIYESHKRGRNWMAVIQKNPDSPNGLARDFFKRAHGEYYYIIPSSLQPCLAVEIGADYYSCGGNPNRKRWYGWIYALSADEMLLVRTETAKQACNQAQAQVAQGNASIGETLTDLMALLKNHPGSQLVVFMIQNIRTNYPDVYLDWWTAAAA